VFLLEIFARSVWGHELCNKNEHALMNLTRSIYKRGVGSATVTTSSVGMHAELSRTSIDTFLVKSAHPQVPIDDQLFV
jgi:hypothetical protein